MPDLSTLRALADLTVSLDTARALKDAGFPQDTVFAWCGSPFPLSDSAPDDIKAARGIAKNESYMNPECAAPTFAEVWALLPPMLEQEWGENRGGVDLYSFGGSSAIEPFAYPGYNYAARLRREALTFKDERPVEAASQLFLALVRAGHIQTTP